MSESSSSFGEDTGSAPPPRSGDIVGAKYRLLRPIAEGGMGVIFEAVHLRLRQSVAIKFPRSDVLPMSDAVERFEREARASSRMRGPHVVHVLDVDTDGKGRPYIVMELLRGRDLEAELRVRGPLPIPQAIDWTLQACWAVAHAHSAGVIHRDLKPSNLFLADEAGASVIKVLDFGVSKTVEDEEVTAAATTLSVGTPLYMSPEQVRSARDVDGRTDIWSLGVVLYELIAGVPPFGGTTTAAIAAIVADVTPSLCDVRPDVPRRLERAIMTALAKAPDDRFPTAEAFGAALMPFASTEGIAGPFSLRPSQRAFEVATSTMARAHSTAHVSDVSELLHVPSCYCAGRPARSHSRYVALRTFASTMMMGVGVSTVVTLLMPSATRGAETADRAPARAAGVVERMPAPTHTKAGAIVAGADAVPPADTVGTALGACHSAAVQLDCRKPSGSNGAGGKSIRRSSEP